MNSITLTTTAYPKLTAAITDIQSELEEVTLFINANIKSENEKVLNKVAVARNKSDRLTGELSLLLEEQEATEKRASEYLLAWKRAYSSSKGIKPLRAALEALEGIKDNLAHMNEFKVSLRNALSRREGDIRHFEATDKDSPFKGLLGDIQDS